MTSSATDRTLPAGKKKALPAFTLTTRDMQLLSTIAECTALTAPQLSRLLFPPAFHNGVPITHSNCLYRLKLLYHSGYLSRYSQPLIDGNHRKPCLYVLAAKGATLLASWRDCPETVFATAVANGKHLSGAVVAHLLLSNDVRLAIMQAVARSNHRVQLTTWLDEPTLRQTHSKDTIPVETATGTQQQPAVVPDGYFVLHTRQPEAHDYHHFLEVDRATEGGQSAGATARDWAGKIQRYQAYYQSGAYQKRYGAQGLRILTVTISDTRLKQLKQITEHIGKTRYWFTTIDRMMRASDILTAPIWQVATKDESFPLLW